MLCPVTETLPATWATEGSFAKLSTLYLHGLSLTGTLPAAWGNTFGSTSGFRQLSSLTIAESRITGNAFTRIGIRPGE